MKDGDFGNKNRVLTSWKEIAAYLGKGVRTVQRWEKDFALPVRRPTGSDKTAILARTADLDTWIATRCATRGVSDSAARRAASFLATRGSLAAGLTTARMLHEVNSALVSEMRAALSGLKAELARMQRDAAFSQISADPEAWPTAPGSEAA